MYRESLFRAVSNWLNSSYQSLFSIQQNPAHVPAALDAVARKYPSREAVVYDDFRMTFSALREQTARLALGLRSLGVKQGDWVGIMMPNCPEFILSFLAVAELNAVVVPIDIYYQSAELEVLLNQVSITTLIISNEFLPTVQSAIRKCSYFKHLILTDPTVDSLVSLYDLMNVSGELKGSRTKISAGDNLLYLFTSGTTGTPKGILLTHKIVLAIALAWRRDFIITHTDKCYTLSPLFRSPALLSVLVAGICYGITMVISSKFQPDEVWEKLVSERITFFHACPFHYAVLAQTPPVDVKKLPRLRMCYSTGNKLPPNVREAFYQQYGIEIEEGYGTSEVAGICANGFPFQGVRIKLIDEQSKTITERNHIGEILVKTPMMVHKYHGAPILSRKTFRNGWFHTGDLGKFDEEGRLRILYRKKRTFLVDNKEVYADKVERTLRTHPKVKDAKVINIYTDSGRSSIKAFVVLEEPTTQDEILSFCSEKLEGHELPTVVEFRAALPQSWKTVMEGSGQVYPKWGE